MDRLTKGAEVLFVLGLDVMFLIRGIVGKVHNHFQIRLRHFFQGELIEDVVIGLDGDEAVLL